MGLSKVRFDPARTFDDGQAYVALSRCTDMAGLSLVSECRAKHLRCDRRAVEVVEHIDALKRLPKDPPALVDPWEQQHPQFGRGRSSPAPRRPRRRGRRRGAPVRPTSPATPSSSRASRSISGATRGKNL